MQRVVRAAGELAVDRDHVLHPADLGRDHDPVRTQAQALGIGGTVQRRAHQRLAQHEVGRLRLGSTAAFRSISRAARSWSRLPQLTPIRTGRSKRSAASTISSNCRSRFSPKPTLPGLMRNLASACGHLREVGQQPMAVVVEVADQRDVVAQQVQPLADGRDGAGGLVVVDGDPHDLGAGARQLDHLRGRGGDVGGVGVGHRLDDDGRAAADDDLPTRTAWVRCRVRSRQCHHGRVRYPTARARTAAIWRSRRRHRKPQRGRRPAAERFGASGEIVHHGTRCAGQSDAVTVDQDLQAAGIAGGQDQSSRSGRRTGRRLQGARAHEGAVGAADLDPAASRPTARRGSPLR